MIRPATNFNTTQACCACMAPLPLRKSWGHSWRICWSSVLRLGSLKMSEDISLCFSQRHVSFFLAWQLGTPAHSTWGRLRVSFSGPFFSWVAWNWPLFFAVWIYDLQMFFLSCGHSHRQLHRRAAWTVTSRIPSWPNKWSSWSNTSREKSCWDTRCLFGFLFLGPIIWT